jgi:opacity protein-like surface antigen
MDRVSQSARPMKRAFVPTFILPLLLLTASPALAAEKEEPTTPPSDAHLRGLELVLRPTIGSAGEDAPVTIADRDAPFALQPGMGMFKWGAGVGAQVGWRFHPFVSAGIRADIARMTTEDVSGQARDLSRSTTNAGLYTRIYPFAMNESIRRHVDPWLGVGVGYGRDVVSFGYTEKAASFEIEATRHAIAIPIGIGIDYRATQWLSVGPSFEYVLMNPIAGCLQASSGAASQTVCSGEGDSKLVASTTGAWNAGVMLRVTPF